MITLRVSIDSKTKNFPRITQIKAWLKFCLEHFVENVEVHVDFIDTKNMRQLNAQYRHKDYATNVLSFADSFPLPNGQLMLGNVILCPAVIVKEAEEQNKPFQDHLVHLLFHGCLHLLGYDHVKAKDAKKMESLEVELLSELGIANPYE